MEDIKKNNRVIINGELEEVDTVEKVDRNGKKYLRGKIVVKTIVDDVENLVECRLFTYEMTKNNTVSKLFTSYQDLPSLLHKRVRVSGSIEENKRVGTNGKLYSNNYINARFIYAGQDNDEDTCSFDYTGFIVKGLYEQRDKEDNLLGYKVELAQANYNDTNCSVLRFDIDKDDVDIATAVESAFIPGYTVSIQGTIKYTTQTETKSVEVAIGKPIVHSYVKSDVQYKLVGSDMPIMAGEVGTYTAEECSKFVAAWKEDNERRITEAENQSAPEAPAAAGGVANEMQKLTRVQSLI